MILARAFRIPTAADKATTARRFFMLAPHQAAYGAGTLDGQGFLILMDIDGGKAFGGGLIRHDICTFTFTLYNLHSSTQTYFTHATIGHHRSSM
jgi:hypothetical protein